MTNARRSLRSPQIGLRVFGAAITVLALGALLRPLWARGFREVTPIPAPGRIAQSSVDVGGEVTDPPEEAAVRDAITDTLEKWNEPGFENAIGTEFYDRSRLTNSLSDTHKVPVDAELTVTGVRNIRVLGQKTQVMSSGQRQCISTVSATVNTELTFNDAASGFQRIAGQNEYVVRVTEVIPK